MISSFVLPANGVMTPEEVERRRKMADALDEQGQINGPIRTPLEGFGKLANALMGGFVRSQADKTEKKHRSNAFSAMTNALVSGGTASSQPVSASPANTKGADPGIVAYIREAAVKRGINPDIAVRVAMSEGLKANPADGWQSNVAKNGRRERSFWPYQLYMDGGLGNEFAKKEGFDPNSFDPNAPGLLNKSIDFALDKARQGGWGPWNGAKAIGLDQWAGIDRNTPAMAQGQPQPANYTPSQDGGMLQQAQTGNRMQQLQSVIMSQDFQWLPPEQQQFVMQAYEAERAAMNPDPMKQLQMQKLQAEIAKMQSDSAPDARKNYGLQPQYGVDANGNPVLLQLGSDATAQATKMPEGVRLSKEPIKLDAGTSFILLDPITRQPVGQIPKDVAGEAAARERGKETGGAQAQAPAAVLTAQQTVQKIDELLSDPNLSGVSGIESWLPDSGLAMWSGSGALGLRRRVEQLKGTAFLEAYNGLRGGGQITEVEGKKAEDAMARLETAQNDADYLKALKDFRDAVVVGYQKLAARAGGQAPALTIPPAPSGPESIDDLVKKYGG